MNPGVMVWTCLLFDSLLADFAHLENVCAHFYLFLILPFAVGGIPRPKLFVIYHAQSLAEDFRRSMPRADRDFRRNDESRELQSRRNSDRNERLTRACV